MQVYEVTMTTIKKQKTEQNKKPHNIVINIFQEKKTINTLISSKEKYFDGRLI